MSDTKLPPLPPVVYDERAIRAARKILNPKPEWREHCQEEIRAALASLVFTDSLYLLRRQSIKQKKELQKLLAALKKAQHAKAKLLWHKAREFEAACDLEEGIAFCEREEKQKKTTPRPPSHRQMTAVMLAYYLVKYWLPDINGAVAISRRSAWFKLSKILFGKDTDLITHMSNFKKGRAVAKFNREPGSK